MPAKCLMNCRVIGTNIYKQDQCRILGHCNILGSNVTIDKWLNHYISFLILFFRINNVNWAQHLSYCQTTQKIFTANVNMEM